MKSAKKVLSVLLAVVLLVCTLSIALTAQAKTKAPAKVKGLKNTYASMVSEDPYVVKLKFKWKKQSGVSGYQFYFSKGKKKYTVRGKDNCKYTIKYKPTNKVYYFKVRAYKVVKGKKVYGPWSKKLWTEGPE